MEDKAIAQECPRIPKDVQPKKVAPWGDGRRQTHQRTATDHEDPQQLDGEDDRLGSQGSTDHCCKT